MTKQLMKYITNIIIKKINKYGIFDMNSLLLAYLILESIPLNSHPTPQTYSDHSKVTSRLYKEDFYSQQEILTAMMCDQCFVSSSHW